MPANRRVEDTVLSDAATTAYPFKLNCTASAVPVVPVPMKPIFSLELLCLFISDTCRLLSLSVALKAFASLK
jgi:hypothetical protein